MFQNDCGIVVGFDNVSVLNFDAHLLEKLYQLSRTLKMTGIREVRFINQTMSTKSVCNSFKAITTP
jgi:hypothetical protein